MAAKKSPVTGVRRGVSSAKSSRSATLDSAPAKGIQSKRIQIRKTADDALTITFPQPITDLVSPITKRDGEIPVEFLFVFLEQFVAIRAQAVMSRLMLEEAALVGFPQEEEPSSPRLW